MGEGVCRDEDGRNRGEEGVTRRGGGHPPDQAKPDRNSFKRLPVPGRDPDRGVDQLVREDGGDLRRHRVGRVRQVRPDEDFEVPVTAAPVVPALADRLALGAAAGEADRNADAGGQGSIQRLEQRRHAARHPVQPALAIVVVHVPSSFLTSPSWRWPSAIGPASWRTAGGEGAAEICRGGAGARSEAEEPRPG